MDSVRERSKTLVEMAQWLRFYFTDHIIYDGKAAAKFFTAETAAAPRPVGPGSGRSAQLR